VKINRVKTEFVKAYPVMTKYFDMFNPYTEARKGEVFEVGLFDCSTKEAFNITN
jgi:hypothetical protein